MGIRNRAPIEITQPVLWGMGMFRRVVRGGVGQKQRLLGNYVVVGVLLRGGVRIGGFAERGGVEFRYGG